MYVAVKGGEKAIANAHALLAAKGRGTPTLPEVSAAQIKAQLAMGVARIMAEGSLYDPELAALALKQSYGDMIEAIFLLRAYRTTLPRFGYSVPLDTGAMVVARRISATFKDLPGGQVLGPTFDYTHRLLDFSLLPAREDAPKAPKAKPIAETFARVCDLLAQEGVGEAANSLNAQSAAALEASEDLTRAPLTFPLSRALRLQALSRGDEGFLLALGYSTQRGFGRTHPFVGEIRYGRVDVVFFAEELGFEITLGVIEVTECETVNQFKGTAKAAPQFTSGFGLVFGQSERKAIAMALVDRALRAGEFGEERKSPAQDEEFVLSHCDNVQATGFVEHLKLPHYVDFQSELSLLRKMRKEYGAAKAKFEAEQKNPATDDLLASADADAQGVQAIGEDA